MKLTEIRDASIITQFTFVRQFKICIFVLQNLSHLVASSHQSNGSCWVQRIFISYVRHLRNLPKEVTSIGWIEQLRWSNVSHMLSIKGVQTGFNKLMPCTQESIDGTPCCFTHQTMVHHMCEKRIFHSMLIRPLLYFLVTASLFPLSSKCWPNVPHNGTHNSHPIRIEYNKNNKSLSTCRARQCFSTCRARLLRVTLAFSRFSLPIHVFFDCSAIKHWRLLYGYRLVPPQVNEHECRLWLITPPPILAYIVFCLFSSTKSGIVWSFICMKCV